MVIRDAIWLKFEKKTDLVKVGQGGGKTTVLGV